MNYLISRRQLWMVKMGWCVIQSLPTFGFHYYSSSHPVIIHRLWKKKQLLIMNFTGN